MVSKILNVLLASVIIGLSAYYFYMRPKFSDGDVAPEIKTELVDGKPFSLEDLKGDYVLLNFWGSWCGTCRRKNPEMVELYNRYGKKELGSGNKIQFVSVALEKDNSQWEKAVVKDGLTWPLHIKTAEGFDSPIAKSYGVKSIPTTYLIGPDGAVISVNDSFDKIDAFLSKL